MEIKPGKLARIAQLLKVLLSLFFVQAATVIVVSVLLNLASEPKVAAFSILPAAFMIYSLAGIPLLAVGYSLARALNSIALLWGGALMLGFLFPPLTLVLVPVLFRRGWLALLAHGVPLEYWGATKATIIRLETAPSPIV